MNTVNSVPFASLEIGWQAALEQMWLAYTKRCSPIGAAVVNAANEVVAVGRNSIGDPDSDMIVRGHQLAHAELNAILQLSEYQQHPDIRTYKLYTTLEPCPACFGAIVMGSIRRVAYAAPDATGGAAALNNSNDYIRRKNIQFEGPVPWLTDPIFAIKTCHAYEKFSDPTLSKIISSYTKASLVGVLAGELLFKRESFASLTPRDTAAAFVLAQSAVLEALDKVCE